MRKILIAEASKTLGEALGRCLGIEYSVTYCRDGGDVIKIFHELDPELLVLDLALPNIDGITILGMLRASGKNLPVVVITPNISDYIVSSLQSLNVSRLFLLPCSLDSLACAIRLTLGRKDASLWDLETELDNILLCLGFRMGPSRYENVRTAVLLKYYGEAGGVTKCLYPAVATHCGGNAMQVEKSIRDAIRHAFKTGDQDNWRLFFFNSFEEQCPSNDMFIARIACALKARDRVCKAGKIKQLKIENE